MKIRMSAESSLIVKRSRKPSPLRSATDAPYVRVVTVAEVRLVSLPTSVNTRLPGATTVEY
jgi:hypothetical protein